MIRYWYHAFDSYTCSRSIPKNEQQYFIIRPSHIYYNSEMSLGRLHTLFIEEPLALSNLAFPFTISTDFSSMENEKGENSSRFKMGNSAQERGLPYVPDCYVVPPSCEPRDALDSNTKIVPTIDVSRLKAGDDERRGVIQELSFACRNFGFFQVSYFTSYVTS